MNTRMKTLAAALCGLLTLAAVAAEPVPLFSGSDSYVDLGTPAALQIPSNEPFTVEGWVYFNVLSKRDMLYSKSNGRATGGGQYTYMFGVYETGRLAAHNGTAWVEPSPTAKVVADEWVHLAYSFNGTTLTFYRNGLPVGAVGFSYTEKSTQTVKIGGYDTTSDINGHVSDVRVWDHARTQSEILQAMSNRLTGAESGLLGYWPLDEGAGSIAYDRSAGVSDGEMIGAGWTSTETLPVGPSAAGFSYAFPFTIAAIETGSAEFTNSNEVEVVDFPVPEGCGHYQVTLGDEPAAIDPDDWIPTNDLPATLTFPRPPLDTNVTLVAWFTNTADTVTVRRAMSSTIRFTTNAPVPVARATYERGLVPGYPVVLEPAQIDDGSTGGETGGLAIPIHALSLHLVSGPDTNATPTEPVVTVAETGTYGVELIVVNAAGNVATSSVCQVTVTAIAGGAFEWTGAAGADWFEPLNWDQKAVPVADSDVVVAGGANILLPSATPDLASFTLTGGTLTFSNWTTRLNAAEIDLQGGTLTHAICDTAVSATNIHRVHLVCTNLLLGSGAQINVYERGYRGGTGATVPGQGPGGALNGGGGSYGGRGSLAVVNSTGVGGPLYGEATDPVLPGSGGGGSLAGGATDGRPGGGAVRIEASGTVTVNGTINASCARDSGVLAGQGSGGAVSIQCQRFAASNGTIRADGGGRNRNYWSYGGCGGGGRIAIVYDTEEQALQNQIAKPGVTLSVDGGNHTGHGGNGKAEYRAFPGSIHLSDASFFPGTVLAGGRIEIPGFDAWPYETLSIDGGLVEFPAGFDLSMPGDLILSGSGGGVLLSNVCIDIGGDVTDTATDGYSFITADASATTHVGGRLLLNKFGALMLRATGETCVPFVLDGDCVVTNTAKLMLESAVTNAPWPGPGTRLTVGGELLVAAASGVYLVVCSETTNALPVCVSARNLTVLPGGVVSADSAGYAGGNLPAGITGGSGPGRGKQYGGGGHGGKGGERSAGQGGAIYGEQTVPLMPGSGGGTWYNGNGNYGGAGGGVVWLEVVRRLVLNGTISANGEGRGNYAAGGSGGSIYIRCTHFSGTGHLQADGGYARLAGDGSGSGGGGRIAVWRQTHTFSGIAAQPAAGAAYSEERRGDSGTLYWGTIPAGGTIFVLR